MREINRRNFFLTSLAATAAARMSPRGLDLTTPQEASRKKRKTRVAIIGCGRLGQYYSEVYRALPDTELVAIAEWNPDRRQVVGKRFGVKALYRDVHALLKEIVPDVAAVVTPTKFMKDAVIACAEAGVKGVSTDKPIAARLSDADEMVEACSSRGVVFAGGNLQRAMWEVQEAARRINSGQYGQLAGAAIHGFGGQISGGGCQHLSVLRLFAGAEVDEVMAWGFPPETLEQESDDGLNINGVFHLSSGLDCQVFATQSPHHRGLDVWTDDALVRWSWGPPKIFQGKDSGGVRKETEPSYPPFPWRTLLEHPGLRAPSEKGVGDSYMVASIRSFLDAVERGSQLWISGHDLRQALEIVIACKLSAQSGNRPVKLPLEDRSLALYPVAYRWLGGDATGNPQTEKDAKGKKL